jgi:hypothetical protein
MQTLNINIVYTFNRYSTTTNELINYNVYISYNENDCTIYVYNDYLQARNYDHLLELSLEKTLNYLEKSKSDFSTIHYNTVNLVNTNFK